MAPFNIELGKVSEKLLAFLGIRKGAKQVSEEKHAIDTDSKHGSGLKELSKGANTITLDDSNPNQVSTNRDISTRAIGNLEEHGQFNNSGSTTPNSASTYEYSHEPYESYQHKVRDLISSISGHDVELMDRIRGGSSNRIIAVKFAYESEGSSKVGVLRVPRIYNIHDDAEQDRDLPSISEQVLDQTSILGFIYGLALPVPNVLAFDATSNNVIKSPYSLLSFAKGTRLDDLYEHLSHDERRQVVDQFIDLLVQQDSVSFTVAGRLHRREPEDGCPKVASSLSDASALGYNSGQVSVKGFGTNRFGHVRETRPVDDLYGMFEEQFDAQIADERNPDTSIVIPMVQKLKVMLREMKESGLISTLPSQNVLYHPDLEPRNLLFKNCREASDDEGTNTWKLSAVLDWDDALSLPQILTRKPPVWIWDTSEYFPGEDSIPDDYDEDYDLLGPSFYDGHSGRLSSEERELKSYFENRLVEKLAQRSPSYNLGLYLDEAYGTGQLLRRLGRFAISSFHSSCDIKRFERFVEDWDRFKADH